LKRVVIAVVIVLAVVGVIIVRGLLSQQEDGGLQYEIARVAVRPMWVKVSATGYVEPFVDLEVKSKASGVVVELPVEEGDGVARGQVIARLDPTEILNELERDEALLEVAAQAVRVQQGELDRIEALAAGGLVAERELDASRLELERARSERVTRRIAVANWKEKLDDTVLRSPIDGVVLERFVEIGQVISSGVSSVTGGTPIAVIADLREVYVKADVDETDIGRVRRDQCVNVVPDAFPDLRLSGIVERISPKSKVIQNVTTFEVVTKVDNADGLLRAGMNATVEIIIAGKDEALTVPRKAVRSSSEVPILASYLGLDLTPGSAGQSDGVVFVKSEGGISVRAVGIGLVDWNSVEITQGLDKGEEVLVFQTSRALEQSKEFLERRRRMAVPGMRRSGS
jgi:HlyD family secretion protein